MLPADSDFWTSLLRRTLTGYDDTWLRQVCAKLVRPRNQWPADELIDRAVAIAGNPAVVDRRLKELGAPSRQILAAMGHSRQPCWSMGNLIEIGMALGNSDGLQLVRELVEGGLLFPTSPATLAAAEAAAPRIRGFDQWLAGAGPEGLLLFAPPLVVARAIGEDLGLPDLSEIAPAASSTPQEADGLEWLLRLAVLWQQVAELPLRRTQQGGFFKRDLERLGGDPLLNAPTADQSTVAPDLGFLLAALAELIGMVAPGDGELRAGVIPVSWNDGLGPALECLFAQLPRLRFWNPLDGWRGPDAPAGNPFASAGLLALLLLARLPEGKYARPDDIDTWIREQHPYWIEESMRPSRQKPWVETFLLGVAFPLRLVQTASDVAGQRLVRLAPIGRWLLGIGELPALDGGIVQTLTVQPNLEIIAFRQGLTPALIAGLSRFAAWKGLGPACTLQLEPGSVYRALESGESFESIRLLLERHATRGLPDAILDSLRTWSNKRDRITIYPAAMLLEFETAADLNEALARGVPAQRIADNLAVLAAETEIDYRHFRLSGTRDYGLPPEKCATVEPDGVTLAVDVTRSDLLLETELPRFAEPLPATSGTERRYRLTPASLRAAREAGWSPSELESWFRQRTGQPLPASARLLMAGAQSSPVSVRRHLVIHVPDEELADGLMQWPQTKALIAERLGPTALSIAEGNLPAFRQRLQEAGLPFGAEP